MSVTSSTSPRSKSSKPTWMAALSRSSRAGAVLQEAQARAHHLAGVREGAGGDLLIDEAVERVGQADVAGRHEGKVGVIGPCSQPQYRSSRRMSGPRS